MDKKLQGNKTEESIKLALENVGLYMPTTVRKDSRRLVDAYATGLAEAVTADLTPDISITLKLCKPKVLSFFKLSSGITLGEVVGKMKMIKQWKSEEQARKSSREFVNKTKTKKWKSEKRSPTCFMCEYAMSALEKLLITNQTAVKIIKLIVICNF